MPGETPVFARRIRHWRWPLLVLLLFVSVQAGLFAHALDADAHDHGESCDVSLLAHFGGAPTTPSFSLALAKNRFEAPVVSLTGTPTTPFHHPYAPRAPPV
ncbi:MAG TPA: hypothetical protein ENN42_10040 [Thioalkalivibrio sp.]|nr:hypothetical protein [Thioalkalivibrio sp.]